MVSAATVNANSEAAMTQPLSRYLAESGHVAYCEVPNLGTAIDIVGWRSEDDSLIVIEMKCVCSQQVIRQAAIGQLVTPLAYCAVRTQPRRASIARCRKLGVGLLRVHLGRVAVVLCPQDPSERRCRLVIDKHRTDLLDVIRTMEPGGIAGLPNGPQCTPAQDCEQRIAEYRNEHPNATWQEIFDNVPNHYAHARSMQQAMRLVAERRAWKDRQL